MLVSPRWHRGLEATTANSHPHISPLCWSLQFISSTQSHILLWSVLYKSMKLFWVFIQTHTTILSTYFLDLWLKNGLEIAQLEIKRGKSVSVGQERAFGVIVIHGVESGHKPLLQSVTRESGRYCSMCVGSFSCKWYKSPQYLASLLNIVRVQE